MFRSFESSAALGWLLIGALIAPASLAAQSPLNNSEQEPAAAIDFAHQIVPILRTHCVECHASGKAEGGFSIETRRSFLESDAAIPGDAAGSYVIELMTSTGDDLHMPPPDRPAVTAAELQLLKQWIDAELPWEDGFSFGSSAYEPPLLPRRPELPPVVAGRENPIDRLLDNVLVTRGDSLLQPIDDSTFLRRVHLDLVGLLPSPELTEAFLADSSPDKRERLIAQLLSDDIAYAEHWLTFWNDLLRNDYDGTGFITGGRTQISTWLYEALVTNKPYNQMAHELIAPPTAASRGFIDGIRWRGEVSAGQTVEIQFAQSVAQSLLGINLKCASCHDSFIDRWTLDEAYGLAAIYSERPLEIHRCDKPAGRMAEAAWLFPEIGQIDPTAARDVRLNQLADLMVDERNGRFARTIVNRLWHRMMGRGIVHPLDAMQTAPWNADLLDYLASELVARDYDLRQILALIAESEAYQSQIELVADEMESGEYQYRGPRAKRLTAEQFLDAVWQLSDAAPTTFDAPVVRGGGEVVSAGAIDLQADWIWGESAAAGQVPPAGETIVFQKQLEITNPVTRAYLVVTCDNEFRLFVNGRQVLESTEWTRPQSIDLTDHLQPGENQWVVMATNAGAGPNAAGLWLQGEIQFAEAEPMVLKSDASWMWSAELFEVREGRLVDDATTASSRAWKAAVVVPALDVWSSSVNAVLQTELQQQRSGNRYQVRAALLKADGLMRALGRPNRDQIVSMRPTVVTSLEAIELANGSQLAKALTQGGERWVRRYPGDSAGLAQALFQHALCRDPSPVELETVVEVLGAEPEPEVVADLLWSICMLPEFLLVR